MHGFQYGKELAIIVFFPVMYPFSIYSAYIHHSMSLFILSTSIVLFGLYFFIKHYRTIFGAVEGFIKRVVISFILFNTSSIWMLSVPDGSESFAAIFLYVFLPSFMISMFLLIKSKPASQVFNLYAAMRDKKI